MLYYTILYYTILYYTILYYTILYYTVLYSIALHCIVLYCTVLYFIIWLTDFACCDWSIPGSQVAVRTASSRSPFQNRNNRQSHILSILLASFARSVQQVMDPRFFLPCFHGPRASRLGHRRKEKTRSITCRTDLALG